MLPTETGHEGCGARLTKAVCERPRVPVECREIAHVVALERGYVHRSGSLNAALTIAAGVTEPKGREKIHAARVAAVAGWVEGAPGETVQHPWRELSLSASSVDRCCS